MSFHRPTRSKKKSAPLGVKAAPKKKETVTLFFVKDIGGKLYTEKFEAKEQPTRYKISDEHGGFVVAKERASLTEAQALDLFIKDTEEETRRVKLTLARLKTSLELAKAKKAKK